jgi:hypothetical protein
MLKSDQQMKWGKMRAAFFELQDIGFKGVLLKVTEKKTGKPTKTFWLNLPPKEQAEQPALPSDN